MAKDQDLLETISDESEKAQGREDIEEVALKELGEGGDGTRR